MAKAKYFTQNNEKVYPISHTKAVYDGKGKVLEDRLTEDETAISSLQTDVKGKADKTDVDNKLSSNGAISDTTVAFTEASARENIVSNEKSSTLFGKVQKWFSDLKKVAFTGSYNDLIDTPSNATSDTDGFMSKEDKSTVDSLNSTFLDKSSARYSFFNLLKWNSSNNKIVEIDNRSTPVYYGGNEIATKSDIPSTSDFFKTSGGTLTGNVTIKNNTNYGTKLNFGDGDYVHIAEVYDDAMELKGSNIHLGIETSKAVWLQSSNSSTTKYKVVGTSTGYNTKIHVATSQPSTMSVGDIWFKISS